MKQFIFLSILIFSGISAHAQPANDDCTGATVLAIDAGLTCGEDASSASLEAGECFTNYAMGSTESSMWYRITANNDSLVMNFIITNSPNCTPHIAIYGPFAAGLGCNPSCAFQIYDVLQTGDPGNHELITGLTPGSDYLVQVQNNSCGGPGDGDITFCLGMDQPADNALSTGASLIDECGTIFSETTDGGYWNSGSGTSFADLDSTAGNDVGFVINNFAWNTFCSLTSGTWQITVNGVSNCNLSAPNQGIQAAVFTGTQAALTLVDSQSPIAPGGSWTSPVITVDSAECAYLGIDGFAGDVCDYQVTLTNITGGCTILSDQFIGMTVEENAGFNTLSWEVANEYLNDYFIIEKSYNGESFTEIGRTDSYGDHPDNRTYTFDDNQTDERSVYYRLKEVNLNGESNILAIKYLKHSAVNSGIELDIFPNPVQDKLIVSLYHNKIRANTQIIISDINGLTVYSNQIEATKGLNLFDIDLVDLNKGSYILKVVTSEKVNTKRFIKN